MSEIVFENGVGPILDNGGRSMGTASMNGSHGLSVTLTFSDGTQISCLHEYAFVVRD